MNCKGFIIKVFYYLNRVVISANYGGAKERKSA